MKPFVLPLGRKFWMTLGCGAVTSVLLWFGKLDDGSYTAIILATVGAYIAGNVYQKNVTKTEDGQPSSSAQ